MKRLAIVKLLSRLAILLPLAATQARGAPAEAPPVAQQRQLAEQGQAQAQVNLAMLYIRGRHLPQDYKEAAKWLRRAAEQGLAGAQLDLAGLYANGQGVFQDYGEAAKWLRLAAEQGQAEAQFNLGRLHLKGLGMPQDEAAAAKWFRLAAQQGIAYAQHNLGSLYRTGTGVARNDAEAVKWLRLAAAQDDALAQYSLGEMHAEGAELPKDLKAQAAGWLEQAAAQGLKEALRTLGLLRYREGAYEESYLWLCMAQLRGADVAQARHRAGQQLSAAARKSAQKKAHRRLAKLFNR